MNKRETEIWVRGLADNYRNNEVIGLDREFMLMLLQNHPEWEEKKGCGIKRIEVRENHHYKTTLGFWLVRDDDTEVAISWVTALRGQVVNGTITKALRFEIQPQIDGFKILCDDSICGLCETSLVSMEALHIDHVIPFKQLVSDWMKFHAITYEMIETKAMKLGSKMSNVEQAKSWFDYHLKHSQLRKVHARCNLKRRI
jgi:ribosomal protein L14